MKANKPPDRWSRGLPFISSLVVDGDVLLLANELRTFVSGDASAAILHLELHHPGLLVLPVPSGVLRLQLEPLELLAGLADLVLNGLVLPLDVEKLLLGGGDLALGIVQRRLRGGEPALERWT